VIVPEFPVYLFDVDGTLVDSAADICGAVKEVLQQRPLESPVDDAFLRRYIGHHLTTLFTDLFPEAANGEIDALICEYRRIYPERDHSSTHLYPGVVEALAALPGRKSTVTTKGSVTLRYVLEKFGIAQYFDHIQGTDGFPAKPAPDVVVRALDALSARPEDCLLVGDAAPDMEAGRRAGVKICAVRYGYGDQSEMANWKPDYWIDDLRELLPRPTTSDPLRTNTVTA
jgi:HAD superfamily hydrolase (TIGR01509 family)